MEEMKRNCELCGGEASVHCSSDNAFLCYSCDTKVHCANFLVARHIRSLICVDCGNFEGNMFSGTGAYFPAKFTCRNCSPPEADQLSNDDDGDDSLSSSSCISSTGEGGDEGKTTSSRKVREKADGRRREKKTTMVDLKVEGVLVNWCKRLGVVEEGEITRVVNMAVELMSGYLDRITVLPFRIAFASSFWVAVRVFRRGEGGEARCSSSSSSSSSTPASSPCQDLKKVEQISGVPAKLILATEAKLALVIKHKRSRQTHEEGWAEC